MNYKYGKLEDSHFEKVGRKSVIKVFFKKWKEYNKKRRL